MKDLNKSYSLFLVVSFISSFIMSVIPILGPIIHSYTLYYTVQADREKGLIYKSVYIYIFAILGIVGQSFIFHYAMPGIEFFMQIMILNLVSFIVVAIINEFFKKTVIK